MNHNTILIVDFETGSANPRRCQPLQIAAVAIDSRKLEIIENGIFQSYIKNVTNPTLYGLDDLQDKALQVNNIDINTLVNAPPIDVVWSQFINFVNQFNTKNNKFTAPIFAGYNSFRFDEIIVQRLCGGQKRFSPEIQTEIYGFGPWNKENEEQTLFHPRDSIDIMKLVWYWTENKIDYNSLSFDAIREHFGITKLGAHNAIADVIGCAFLLIKFLKLSRRINVKFANSFTEENKLIAELYNKHAGIKYTSDDPMGL